MTTMTVGELRELLATMGANEEERNAPVLVNRGELVSPVTAAELLNGPDWTSEYDGPFLLLQAEAVR
jgi:hypothetical protein